MSTKDTKPDLARLLTLQQMLLTFSNIRRVVDRSDGAEAYILENDSEHSYNLAMTAWFLCQYFPELNETTVLKLALAHDLLEVHAGDTYIYGDPAHIATKKDREAKALEQLTHEWPDFPDSISYMQQYNARETAEARFVYALDKIMPIMQIYINHGHSWSNNHITVEMLHAAKKEKVALSPEIQPYYEKLHQLLLDSPDIIQQR